MDATQIAIAERVAEEQRHHKKAQFLWVWAALLVMTGIEVYLTYQNMAPAKMLTILLGLSLIKAALIIGFFMLLRYEISRMKWITMCSVVACLILMTIFFFPDAERIFTLGVNKFRGRDEDTLFNLGGLPFPLQP